MTDQEIKNFRSRISAFIEKGRLRDAINEIKAMASRRMAWEVDDKIKQTEQNYAYMLRYLTNGMADPSRDEVYGNIVSDLYGLLDTLTAYIESSDSPTLYYSALRYRKLKRDLPALPQLIQDYIKAADKLSLFSLVSDKSESSDKADRKKAEEIQSDIFTRIWTSQLLTIDEAASIKEAIDDAQLSVDMKQMIISAVTLGMLQLYDKRKLEILIHTYISSPNMKVSSAALVGMLLALWKYRTRPLPRNISDMLASAKDKPTWSDDLRVAYLELIRARDTERINRKMRDELIPKMERLRPDMLDKMKKSGINPEDVASMQENPEWQEMLDKNGVTDQLKELMEIQMEGGDVMMSTFSHLKQFPFFKTVSNWFLPFDRHHTSVADTMKSLDVMADMMENARFLCDSDKYSFVFALSSMPSQQRDMMVSQMNAQGQNIYEAMSDISASQGSESRRMAVNSYLQNIYRFFKLFGKRGEFYDPFDQSINLISVKALSNDFNDTEVLQVIAEFYFKLKFMEDALNVYEHLENLTPGDASRYQKMGYCHERMRDYDKAIDYYMKSELLDTTSAWTVKRLATCYRLTGQHEMALGFYQQLAQLKPDDLGTSMLLGQSLLENGKYSDAINEFYKVEFLDEKSTQAWRPLAWTLFLNGDFDAAERYYSKILNDNPGPNDYLNMGHVAMACGNMRDAVNNYTLAIKATQGDKEWFVQAMNDDADAIKKAGVDPEIIPLIADATMYALD